MKQFTCLFCYILAANCLRAGEEQNASTGPRITFEETTHDSGIVDPPTVKAAFKFKNTGDKTLEITDIKPACHCTVAEVTIAGQKTEKDKEGKFRVEPGQEGTITAQVDVAKMKGRIGKDVSVTSNDPKTPNVSLHIVATVKANVMVLPQPTVFLDALQSNTTTNRTVEIRSFLAEPLVVENVESSVPWLTVSVGETTTNSATIQLSTKPPIPAGRQSATITAHTKYEKYKDVAITVMSHVVPVISIRPSNLLFAKNKDWKASNLSVDVTRDDGNAFRILEVKPDSTQITGMVTTNEPGHKYRVKVTYVPKQGQGTASGKLVIQTDDPTWSKLEIPYSFR